RIRQVRDVTSPMRSPTPPMRSLPRALALLLFLLGVAAAVGAAAAAGAKPPHKPASSTPKAPETAKPSDDKSSGAPKPATDKKPDAGPAITLNPKGWKLSTYSFDGRFLTSISNVTFDAPPAYKDSFAFWTNRMKETTRTELVELLTTTHDPA